MQEMKIGDSTMHDDLLFRADIAGKSYRFEDMLEYVIEAFALETRLTDSQIQLFTLAARNVVEPLRVTALRISTMEYGLLELNSKLRGRLSVDDKIRLDATMKYKQNVVSKLIDVCTRLIELTSVKILDGLIAKNKEPQVKAFLLKIHADHCRYVAEVVEGNQRFKFAKAALEHYKLAMNEAHELRECHPVRLAIAVNLSVFYSEILGSTSDAWNVAKQAFSLAVGNLNEAEVETYKESTDLIDLLHRNLMMWNKHYKDSNKSNARIATPKEGERSRAESSGMQPQLSPPRRFTNGSVDF